jgi:hypothetical protein
VYRTNVFDISLSIHSLIATSTTLQHEMRSLCSIFVFDASNVIDTDMITIESISSLTVYAISFAIMLQRPLPLLRHLHLHSLPLRLWLSASFLSSSTPSPVAAFTLSLPLSVSFILTPVCICVSSFCLLTIQNTIVYCCCVYDCMLINTYNINSFLYLCDQA